MMELPSNEGHILFSATEGEELQQCRKHDSVIHMKLKGISLEFSLRGEFVTVCFRSLAVYEV